MQALILGGRREFKELFPILKTQRPHSPLSSSTKRERDLRMVPLSMPDTLRLTGSSLSREVLWLNLGGQARRKVTWELWTLSNYFLPISWLGKRISGGLDTFCTNYRDAVLHQPFFYIMKMFLTEQCRYNKYLRAASNCTKAIQYREEWWSRWTQFTTLYWQHLILKLW